ncbi:MAG: hypothetical protein ACXAEU_18065 [Candidatus Hodarchaeales archaeon]|jgi:hypothetical protein
MPKIEKVAVGNNNDKVTTDITKAAVKETLMDFVGHFSTASAILAGFYIATCAFIIGVKADTFGTGAFSFLDEPLLETTWIYNLSVEILSTMNWENFWPSNFQYMILIFISLFLLSLISYAAFMRVGMIQMSIYREDTKVPERIILNWQQRGMNALFISLVLGFISLPWALLRFVFDQALTLTIFLFTLVIIGLVIVLKCWTMARKILRRRKKY